MPILVKIYFTWLFLSMVATTVFAIMNDGFGTDHWTFKLHGYFLNSAGLAWCVGVIALVIYGFLYF